MLRDKSLIPLSRQHQHALALCVRIDRAQPIFAADAETWREEIRQLFQQELRIHFAAEEQVLFPVARGFPELMPVVDELASEHSLLRHDFSKAGAGGMSAEDLPMFANRLSAHIRKEERVLFERLQQFLTPEEIADLGVSLENALKETSEACILPSEATRIRAGRS